MSETRPPVLDHLTDEMLVSYLGALRLDQAAMVPETMNWHFCQGRINLITRLIEDRKRKSEDQPR